MQCAAETEKSGDVQAYYF